jgi:hypothetical protein
MPVMSVRRVRVGVRRFVVPMRVTVLAGSGRMADGVRVVVVPVVV